MRTIEFTEKKNIVRFHVGRGGHFNNPGHKTFVGEENLQYVIRMMHNATIISEDENGNQLPESEWKLICNEQVVLEGEEINAEVGVIDIDGGYDTDICRYIEDCTDEELDLIATQILDGVLYGVSDEIIYYVCKNSQTIAEKYYDAVATFNADPFSVNSDERMAEVAMSAFYDALELMDVDLEDEDYITACEQLNLNPQDEPEIYTNSEMKICFN